MAIPSQSEMRNAFQRMMTGFGLPNRTRLAEEHYETTSSLDDIVKTIDSELDLLSTIEQEFTSFVGLLKSAAAQERNARVAKIENLPGELFSDIIARTQSDPFGLEKLRTVSTTWASRILADKTLWATIDGAHARSKQQQLCLLKRSGNAPLDVVISGFYYYLAEDMLETMSPHRNRWRTLSIIHPTSGMEKWLSSPAPLLERMILGNQKIDMEEPYKDLFRGFAPKLRSFHSSYIATLLNANPTILSGLSELDLTIPDASSLAEDVPTDALSTIVSRCTNLQSLRLYFHNTMENPDTLNFTEPLILPHLQVLRLCVHDHAAEALAGILHGSTPRVYIFETFHTNCFAQKTWSMFPGLLGNPGPMVAEIAMSTITLRPYAEGAKSMPRLRLDVPWMKVSGDEMLFGRYTRAPERFKIVRVEIKEDDQPLLTEVAKHLANQETRLVHVEELAMSMHLWEKELETKMAGIASVIKACRRAARKGCRLPLRRLEVLEAGVWVDKYGEAEAIVDSMDLKG